MHTKSRHHNLLTAVFFKLIIMMMVLFNLSSTEALGKTQQHIIPHIPYFSQQTEYSCGDTSLQMVFSYYDGLFHSKMNDNTVMNRLNTYPFRIISQESIVDVARTSNQTGTCSMDVVRSARFSTISSTPTSQYYLQYPKQAPKNGWFGNENSNQHTILNKTLDSIYYFGGLMTMHYPERTNYLKSNKCSKKKGGEGGVKCWVNEMIENFLKFDIPIICLMFYDQSASEGHYRLAVGYETSVNSNGIEIPTHIIMWDPYNREGNPPISNFTIEEFCNLWNYTEFREENTCYRPYFGAAIYPLDIKAQKKDENLEIVYGHPEHFKSSSFVRNQVVKTQSIDNVEAKIRIYQKIPGENDGQLLKLIYSTELKMNPSTLNFGANQFFSWKIPESLKRNSLEQVSIKIGIYGMVCDSTLTWLYEPNTSKFSEAYKYCDQVGGTTFLNLN